MNFNDFKIAVSKIKNLELPAQESQFKMSPPFRKDLINRYKEQMKNAKRAGVLALFYPTKDNETSIALILRKTYNGVHSAQIGFPGGKYEVGDDNLKNTAIRETYEEIGISSHEIQVLKEMTEVYIPPSNFYVQPYIGISENQLSFTLQDEEVEDLVEVNLNHFLDESIVVTRKVSASYNVDVEVPAFLLNGHVVWGATAMMLNEIKDLLKQVL